MSAGELDQRVSIQSATTAIVNGEQTRTWATLAEVWAKVSPLRGSEFFAAQQVQAEQSLKVKIRYRSGVTPQCRLLWKGVVHDITAVLEIGRREWLELRVQQGLNDG